jgi:hypothetical protein
VTAPGPSASALRRQLALARIEAALLQPANALILGGTFIAAVACFVAQARGMLNPGTWVLVAFAGGAVLAVKLVLDLRDRAADDAVWRAALAQSFGASMRDDLEVTRLARMAIEYRVRLATAQAGAPRAARAALAPLLPRVDVWLQGIVNLARQSAALRAEARFHTAMAGQGRKRQEGRTGPVQGIEAQVRAGEGFGQAAEATLLRLENAVGAFGAGTSQLTLALAHGGAGGMTPEAIAAEIAAVEAQLVPPPPPA